MVRMVAFLGALLLASGSAALAVDRSAGANVTAACDAPEYHQFDFFAGDWDTYDMSAPDSVVARNRVTPILDGCALEEVYDQNDGLHGVSISAWDPSRQQWHQTWVTTRGREVLLLDGRLEGPRMVLEAEEHAADGSTSRLRGIWWREGSAVRERAERTSDGTHWEPVFDIVFRPHRSP